MGLTPIFFLFVLLPKQRKTAKNHQPQTRAKSTTHIRNARHTRLPCSHVALHEHITRMFAPNNNKPHTKPTHKPWHCLIAHHTFEPPSMLMLTRVCLLNCAHLPIYFPSPTYKPARLGIHARPHLPKLVCLPMYICPMPWHHIVPHPQHSYAPPTHFGLKILGPQSMYCLV